MELVTLNELLTDAQQEKYAVGAFNVFNLEGVKNILEAAEELESPVIIQAAMQEIKYSSGECLVGIVKSLALHKKVRIAIHLDHGPDFESAVKCIQYGFTSVMFDGSQLPFEENISQTNKIVEAARAAGVSVEAELGTISNIDESGERINNPYMTDPAAAKDFASRTGIDCLAISFGTVHGLYKHEPELDLARLEAISRVVDLPLVMHGGSGVPDDSVKQSIKRGISKINISSILQKTFTDELFRSLEKNRERPAVMNVFNAASGSMKGRIKGYLKLLGSAAKM